MGKVLLSVSEAVKKSSSDSFWVDLQDCKSGKILISTEFSGSDAKTVVGGGVKELRGLLQSEKGKTQPDEKGPAIEPEDKINSVKAEDNANLNQDTKISKAEDSVAQDPKVEQETKQQTDISAS